MSRSPRDAAGSPLLPGTMPFLLSFLLPSSISSSSQLRRISVGRQLRRGVTAQPWALLAADRNDGTATSRRHGALLWRKTFPGASHGCPASPYVCFERFGAPGSRISMALMSASALRLAMRRLRGAVQRCSESGRFSLAAALHRSRSRVLGGEGASPACPPSAAGGNAPPMASAVAARG